VLGLGLELESMEMIMIPQRLYTVRIRGAATLCGIEITQGWDRCTCDLAASRVAGRTIHVTASNPSGVSLRGQSGGDSNLLLCVRDGDCHGRPAVECRSQNHGGKPSAFELRAVSNSEVLSIPGDVE